MTVNEYDVLLMVNGDDVLLVVIRTDVSLTVNGDDVLLIFNRN